MFWLDWSAEPATWRARRWGSDGGIFQEKDMNRAMRLAAALGINGDNSVGHLSTGEVVIPRGMMSPKLMAALQAAARSEESRVGNECVSTCRSRGSQSHETKQTSRDTTTTHWH